nr:Fanconi anemia core complex-associated protein 20 [Columba livia]
MKDFQWVSFPLFCREKHPEPQDLGSPQLTRSQIHRLHEGRGQADKLKTVPATAEKTCCVTIPGQAKNVVGGDTKGSLTCDLAWSQSSAEALSSRQQCRGTAQTSRENRRESDGEELQIQPNQGKVSLGEAACVPAEQKPPPVNGPGTDGCEETEQSEGSSTLDSCPMCLIRFSGTLSQLDIDGHLARCLSESADDVMW